MSPDKKFPRFSYARQKENSKIVVFHRDVPTTLKSRQTTKQAENMPPEKKFPQFSDARQKEILNMAIFCRDNPTISNWCHSMPTDYNEQKICCQMRNFHNFPMTDKRKTRKFDFLVVITP